MPNGLAVLPNGSSSPAATSAAAPASRASRNGDRADELGQARRHERHGRRPERHVPVRRCDVHDGPAIRRINIADPRRIKVVADWRRRRAQGARRHDDRPPGPDSTSPPTSPARSSASTHRRLVCVIATGLQITSAVKFGRGPGWAGRQPVRDGIRRRRPRAHPVRRAVLTALAAALIAPAASQADTIVKDGSVYARVTQGGRPRQRARSSGAGRATRSSTTALVDKRDGGRTWSAGRRDFALDVAGRTEHRLRALPRDRREVEAARARRAARDHELARRARPDRDAHRRGLPGRGRLPHPDDAAPAAPLALSGATLDEAATPAPRRRCTPSAPAPTGASPAGPGPQLLGRRRARRRLARHAHRGARRRRSTGPAQWLSLDRGGRVAVHGPGAQRPAVVARARTTARRRRPASTTPATSLSLGPFEEQGHVENPAPGRRPGRARVLAPGEPLALPAAFTGFGARRRRRGLAVPPLPRRAPHRAVPARRRLQLQRHRRATAISTGAKDDMDLATVQQVAPLARRLGVDDVHPRRRLAGARPATGSPTRPSTPSRADDADRRRASPTRRSPPSATRSRR